MKGRAKSLTRIPAASPCLYCGKTYDGLYYAVLRGTSKFCSVRCANTRKNKHSNPPPLERFWAQVDQTGKNGCWLWTGARGKRGYGVFEIQRKQWKAHRFSYAVLVGDIPNGMLVCHKCDNPPCVNPCHLFLGTPEDNVRDMLAKGRGRQPLGLARNAKVTEDQVREMRKLREAGEMIKTIAKRFGVRRELVSLVTRRITWKHVSEFVTIESKQEN